MVTASEIAEEIRSEFPEGIVNFYDHRVVMLIREVFEGLSREERGILYKNIPTCKGDGNCNKGAIADDINRYCQFIGSYNKQYILKAMGGRGAGNIYPAISFLSTPLLLCPQLGILRIEYLNWLRQSTYPLLVHKYSRMANTRAAHTQKKLEAAAFELLR